MNQHVVAIELPPAESIAVGRKTTRSDSRSQRFSGATLAQHSQVPDRNAVSAVFEATSPRNANGSRRSRRYAACSFFGVSSASSLAALAFSLAPATPAQWGDSRRVGYASLVIGAIK